jgi:hypothetical protein
MRRTNERAGLPHDFIASETRYNGNGVNDGAAQFVRMERFDSDLQGPTPTASHRVCCAASVTVLPYGQAAWTRALSVKRRVRREKQDLGRCVTVVASFSDVECQGGAQPAESPGSTIQWTDSCGSRKGRPATSVSPAPAARANESRQRLNSAVPACGSASQFNPTPRTCCGGQ